MTAVYDYTGESSSEGSEDQQSVSDEGADNADAAAEEGQSAVQVEGQEDGQSA